MAAATMAGVSAAYDIIFMDMQMPIKDGLTAIREIRRMRVHKQTPITANAFEKSREECLAAGMNDFI